MQKSRADVDGVYEITVNPEGDGGVVDAACKPASVALSLRRVPMNAVGAPACGQRRCSTQS